MNSGRPTNLNLFNIRWPVTALVSITHRVSGILLFLAIAPLLFLFDLSLSSEAGFERAIGLLSPPAARLALWFAAAAMAYHLIAGCRHLLMDIGIGETWRGGRLSALAVIALSGVTAVLLGLWLAGLRPW